jgi:hypothetical protein
MRKTTAALLALLLFAGIVHADEEINVEYECEEGGEDGICVVEVEEEYANTEFLREIDGDMMIKGVIMNINQLVNYLDSRNHTMKRAGSDEDIDCSDLPVPLSEDQQSEDFQNMSDEDKEDWLTCKTKDEQTSQAATSLQGLRRFVELKQLVSWLQPKDKRISRYCFYGCWCLPEGAHSFVSGEGRPVDLVDQACQYLWFCYTCAKQDFKGIFGGKQKDCIPDRRRYSFKFKMDKYHKMDHSKRDIICKDKFFTPMDTKYKQGSNCARAICECDRGLARRLYRVYKHWDKSRHRIWSQKVVRCKQLDDCKALPEVTEAEKLTKSACLKRGCLFIVKRRCLGGCEEVDPIDCPSPPPHALICCGLFTDDGSRFEMRDHGGTHACCDHDIGTGSGPAWDGNWYNTLTHCCPNGRVYAFGSGLC